MTVLLSNIMENLRKFFNGGHEGHDNLEATWLANTPTLRLENFEFDIAKCTIDSTVI